MQFFGEARLPMRFRLMVTYWPKDRQADFYFSTFDSAKHAADGLLTSCCPVEVTVLEHEVGRGYTKEVFASNNHEQVGA